MKQRFHHALNCTIVNKSEKNLPHFHFLSRSSHSPPLSDSHGCSRKSFKEIRGSIRLQQKPKTDYKNLDFQLAFDRCSGCNRTDLRFMQMHFLFLFKVAFKALVELRIQFMLSSCVLSVWSIRVYSLRIRLLINNSQYLNLVISSANVTVHSEFHSIKEIHILLY